MNGIKINGYTLIKKLGSGAFGEAFLVSKQNKRYVLKAINIGNKFIRIKPELDALLRISEKADKNTLSNIVLIDHFILSYPQINNINTFKDKTSNVLDDIPAEYQLISKDDKMPYAFVTNYLENAKSLREIIKIRHGRCSLNEILFIMGRLISQMYTMHNAGLVHGDIKPDNIIVEYTDNTIRNIIFIDLGLSCTEEICNVGGTINYMAPEIFKNIGKKIKNEDYKKADIFSLGLVFYEIINVHLPSNLVNMNPWIMNNYYKNIKEYKLSEYKTNIMISKIDPSDLINKIINNMLIINPDNRSDINEIKILIDKISILFRRNTFTFPISPVKSTHGYLESLPETESDTESESDIESDESESDTDTESDSETELADTELEERSTQEGSGAQFYGHKSKVMVKVPSSVKAAAEYSYKLRDYGFKGGLSTGIKRAKQLSTKEYIPIEDLRYMRAWYARHIYTSHPSYRKWVDAGRPKNETYWHNKHGIYAWQIWSANAGFKWVNSASSLRLLNKHYPNKNYKPIKVPHK
jgi:serine/threonine protein kinase